MFRNLLNDPHQTDTSKGIEVISYKVHTGSKTSGHLDMKLMKQAFGEFRKSHMKRPGVQGSFHQMTDFNDFFRLKSHPVGDVTRVSLMPRKVTVKIGDAENRCR